MKMCQHLLKCKTLWNKNKENNITDKKKIPFCVGWIEKLIKAKNSDIIRFYTISNLENNMFFYQCSQIIEHLHLEVRKNYFFIKYKTFCHDVKINSNLCVHFCSVHLTF